MGRLQGRNINDINVSNIYLRIGSSVRSSLAWPDLFFLLYLDGGKAFGYLTIEFLCCRIHGYCGVLTINDKLKRKC